MKIEQLEIRNYRSIRKAIISNIGQLNAFIGKNNSGKSNLLSSIEVYFSCMRSGEIIVERPALVRPLEKCRGGVKSGSITFRASKSDCESSERLHQQHLPRA
jgi:predicted ATP-binding protein involved in virulence